MSQCVDPLVGKILAGWRYDISGLAPEMREDYEHHFAGLSPARWLALFIATGIGLHNFSEGLAIGQSAARDELSLAFVLIIGFGLHNATEGFGIVAPLATEPEAPSWGFLGVLGLIGGAPTFFGTALGQASVASQHRPSSAQPLQSLSSLSQLSAAGEFDPLQGPHEPNSAP